MKKTRNRRRGPAAMAAKPTRAAAPPGMPRPARDRRTWLVAAPLLVLLVFAAFGPALANGLVNSDDDVNFATNARYRGLGWPQVRWAWTTFLLGVYQPLAWLLLEAQYVLWGLDPRGYHLSSLLLHAANTIALYALTAALLARCRPDLFLERPWARATAAGLATALFAAHPLRVEPVAWASCQPYLPCSLFSMLTVLAYLRAVGDGGRPRRGWLAISVVLFAAALLSKAPAVGLPAVLLILDVYPLGRLGGGPGCRLGPSPLRVWLEKLPFVAASLVCMGLAVAARARSIIPLREGGLGARAAQACYGVWFYLVKTAAPLGITAFYAQPEPVDWRAPRYLLSVAATLAVTVGLILARRRRPGLLAAWLAYLVLLTPTLGLVRTTNYLVADRYSYLPMTVGAVLLAAGLGRPFAAPRRGPAIATAGAAGAAILCLVPLARDQCRIWRTSEALWSHALEHGGESATAHQGLGRARFDQHRLDEAIAEDREAIRLNPDYALVHSNLGAALTRKGRLDEAIAEYRIASHLNPDDATAHSNLATTLHQQGKLAEAITEAREAFRLNPDEAAALNTLAWALVVSPGRPTRDYDEGLAHARKAVEVAKLPENYNTLALAEYRAGHWAESLAASERSMALREGPSALDWFFRSLAHWKNGEKDEARKWFEKAVEWTREKAPRNDDLRRFWTEAAQLLDQPGPGALAAPSGDKGYCPSFRLSVLSCCRRCPNFVFGQCLDFLLVES
jgi:hypothetical protein